MCEAMTKWKQAFYADVEPIKLKDPLAVFLGAIDEGEEIVYTYSDIVKLAGHSCPSVSGAYKVTQKALKALYGTTIPVRGEISVKVLGSVHDGANGPISQVFTFITGAAPETGFAGLGQHFARKNKLVFDEAYEEPHAYIFTRDDTGKSVKVTYHSELLPGDDETPELFTKCIVGTATAKQAERFKELWQKRVRCALLEEVKGLYTIEPLR